MAATVMPLDVFSRLPFDPAMPSPDRCRMLVASFPETLQELLAVGRVERRPRFCNDAFDGISETWSPPEIVSASQAAITWRMLEDMEGTILAPAEPSRLLARVLALLSHYPSKALTPDVEQMIALDWAEDLGEFPIWAIDQAARTWRRTKKWRPSIAEMRALCEDACAGERQLALRLRTIAAKQRRHDEGLAIRSVGRRQSP